MLPRGGIEPPIRGFSVDRETDSLIKLSEYSECAVNCLNCSHAERSLANHIKLEMQVATVLHYH